MAHRFEHTITQESALTKEGVSESEPVVQHYLELIDDEPLALDVASDMLRLYRKHQPSTGRKYLRRDGTIVNASSGSSALLPKDATETATAPTECKNQPDSIGRLSRIHAVLSGINATILREHDRGELYRQACRIAVEHGEFRMAWVALAAVGETKARPVAWVGSEEGFLDETQLCSEGVIDVYGIAERALRDKEPIVINDIEADSHLAIKGGALARGCRSAVALPLLVEDRSVAVMVLYAAKRDFFNDQELKLLNNLVADISFALDHIAKEEKLNYLSHYDALTGLPNLALFRDRLSQLVNAAVAEGSKLAVLVTDVERFGNVNDTLGRRVGDELLKVIAHRLDETMEGSGSVARIGGDCFVIAIPNITEEADIAHVVEQNIFSSISEPLAVGDVELRISSRVGIAVFPADASDADTLIINAEAALKRAKASGDKYLFYTPTMNARIAERLTLESKLRRALEEEQFVLHYQPKVDLKSGRICGLEALIRWQSPELGLVPPGAFIPLLEETGLIVDAGRWVLERAAADYWDLLVKGLQPPRIAVNVSALQLRQQSFVNEVASAIEKGDRGGDLDLEVTESVIMEDVEGTIERLKTIRSMGIGIALDDFGTGFSSLSQLVRLPIDCLKIDRTFIVNMVKSAEHLSIVSAIISLAHSLNLKVIAEGVETEEQAKLLRLLRCDQMQGYLFSRPVPLQQIEVMLRNNVGD